MLRFARLAKKRTQAKQEYSFSAVAPVLAGFRAKDIVTPRLALFEASARREKVLSEKGY
jgi:hypothetical protein